MQKVIAKYGAALHLSLLAAAPLFLFPFFSEEVTAVVWLWLSLPAALWCLAEPSIRQGEKLHQARERVRKNLVADPLFWGLVLIVVLTAVRAFNTGIDLSYDAENGNWRISQAVWPLFPGCVGQAGALPAAASVAALVLISGCRHTLGRSARKSFLLISSALSGVAAIVAVLSIGFGNAVTLEAFSRAATMPFFVGAVFALQLMSGTVALDAVFERGWWLAMPLGFIALAGNLAGFLTFSSSFAVVIFASAELALMGLVFLHAFKVLPSSGEFKVLVVLGISLALGGFLMAAVLPIDVLVSRLSSLAEYRFFPEGFDKMRGALSEVARQSWFSHLWIGTGLGSFPLDLRFRAGDEVWQLVRENVIAVPNGWWHLLVERGIVGVLSLAIPLMILIVTFVRHLIGAWPMRFLPNPAVFLLPLVFIALALVGLFSGVFLRPDVLVTAGALGAVSANSFVRRKEKKNV